MKISSTHYILDVTNLMIIDLDYINLFTKMQTLNFWLKHSYSFYTISIIHE